jgi:hypothetical protein
MPLLRQCLLDTYYIRLQVIARFWDIELTASHQRAAALELAEAMDQPQAIGRVWRTLPDEQRRAMRALLTSGGRMPQRVFAREWGMIRTMGPARMERERPWEEPISPAEALWYQGLLFRGFRQGPDGAYEKVFIPPELRSRLPGSDDARPGIALESAAPPAVLSLGGDLLLDDVCTLLAYVQNERPPVDSDRQLSQRHKQRLLHRLRDQDVERFDFLCHLPFRIGWVVEEDDGRLRLRPKDVTAWLEAARLEQRRALAEAWRDDPTWNDLFRVPSLQPEDTGAWRNDPVLARRAVLRHLEACAPETWYRIDHLIAAIKRVDPDFQRPDGDYNTWYIRDEDTQAYLSGFNSWDAVEGSLIRYLIRRPMKWLGLVDLGAAQDEAPPTAFRLTSDRAAVLHMAEPLTPPKPSPARVRRDFLVSVAAALRYQRFQLARVADWVRSGDHFIYRLTPASLTRARQQGISVTRVLEFLREITDAPIPRSVEAALTRWDACGTEARLVRAALLRLSSEELMDQVASAARLSRLIQERIGPTTAVVREQDWPRAITALAEMGLLPEVADWGEARNRQT